MGFEKLKDDDQIKILNKISEDDYDNQLIIIILKNGFDLDDFPKIHLRFDFSDGTVQEINDLSVRIIMREIKILDDKISEYRNVISKLNFNEKDKNRLLKKLDEYSNGDNLFPTDTVNFWYEIESLEFSDDREETINEWEKIYKGTKGVTHYKIDLDLQNNIWIVEKNGERLKPIKFDTYKAIKYLVYLYKNYSDGKKIYYNDLENVIHNWGKDKKVKLSKVSHSTVANSKSTLFKKRPEFKAIRDFLKLGIKGSGCYYIKNDKVIIELGNFTIPDAVE